MSDDAPAVTRIPEHDLQGEATWGICHLCPSEGPKPVSYCSWCEHYFCAECRKKWWDRGGGFVQQLIAGKYPGCCGPTLNR